MEDAGEEMEESALQDLERLRQEAARLSHEQDETNRKREKIIAMQKTLEELKQKKSELQQKLRTGPKQILGHVLDKQMEHESPGIQVTSEENRQAVLQAVNAVKQRKMEEISNSYRLAGTSVKVLENNNLRFCLDTFHNGQYFEPYYIELQQGDQIKVLRHTLPYFIPVQKLIKEHLNKGLQEFLSVIEDYLNCYVSRRQQVVKLQHDHGGLLEGEVCATSAFDYVSFSTKTTDDDPIGRVQVKLSYEDLLQRLPQKVNFVVEKTTFLPLDVCKKIFQAKQLYDAFQEMFVAR